MKATQVIRYTTSDGSVFDTLDEAEQYTKVIYEGTLDFIAKELSNKSYEEVKSFLRKNTSIFRNMVTQNEDLTLEHV